MHRNGNDKTPLREERDAQNSNKVGEAEEFAGPDRLRAEICKEMDGMSPEQLRELFLQVLLVQNDDHIG